MNNKSMATLVMALIPLAVGCALPAARAEELWDGRLPGVNEGLLAGALPPPGLYGAWDQYWASFSTYDAKGNPTGVKMDALIESPVILWSSGHKVLGGDFGAAMILPFDYTNLKLPQTSQISANGHWGNFNTILEPAIISWRLSNHLFAKAGLAFSLNDASSSPGDPPSGGGIASGNGYTSIMPIFGFSWLKDGWNLSADGQYSYNLPNHRTEYRSGPAINIDYTLARTVGRWSFGLGGYSVNQLGPDSGAGASRCAMADACKAESYGLGPLFSYDFDGAVIHVDYNKTIYARNDVGGNIVNASIDFRL